MEATRLALALLVGFLVLGMCLSKPAQKEKRMQRRYEVRQNSSNCAEDQFTCNSGSCIPSSWQCDEWHDCLDGDDEDGCDFGNCAENRFTCNSGSCIPSSWQCDEWDDCLDGDDEVGCDFGNCAENRFKCNSGYCIPSSWQCDEWDDCLDGDDEVGCDFARKEKRMQRRHEVRQNGLGFAKKKRSASELPSALSKVAKKHMKKEKSLTNEQKEILGIINEKQSAMKKSRLAAKKALVL